MNIKQRIQAFSKLRDKLSSLSVEELDDLYYRASASNSWFTKQNVISAITGIVKMLDTDDFQTWVKKYDIQDSNLRVGLVMAGNIPAVGFHDLICVLISGNIAVVKLSNQDNALMNYLFSALMDIDKSFEQHILVVDQLKDIDAVIATGSDNTSRYFEYYFSKYPNIIRKNRTSCALINGNEDHEELQKLGQDIFQYFGLGCRNVSKIYVPKNYDFTHFFEAMERYKEVIHHHKYNNNYDYNKSIYLVNKEPHLDNGFLLLKESNQLVSPISVLFYEEYESEEQLTALLATQESKIQCLVSRNAWWPGSFQFGEAQSPAIDDYADQVDTLQFLTNIKKGS